MAKIMLFIDGTWLYCNMGALARAYGKPDFHVDFGKLPQVLGREVGKQLQAKEIDVVRTYLFGSYASNYDLQDEHLVMQRRDFYDMLREEYHYELELFPINYQGRRIRRADRDPEDTFEPKEKCVDISLATAMLYFAAIPYAYDIAIAVVGDQDFKPVFQHVRRLGKRVAIASIKGSCAPDYADPRDESRVKDFDIIWINDLLHELELTYERHQLLCESPNHKGDRQVWTTFHPRKNQRFYCDECRKEFERQKAEDQAQYVSSTPEQSDQAGSVAVSRAEGRIRGVVARRGSVDRGFGFLKGDNGKEYFFHLSDLRNADFEQVQVGMVVEFEVKREPSEGKAGAAMNVVVLAGDGDDTGGTNGKVN